MQLTLRTSLILALFSLLWSCKDKGDDQPPVSTAGKPVFVVCEGAYGSGNGTLSLHHADSNTTVEDAFAAANSGQKLGDIFQSMIRLSGGDYLLCINVSDRVLRIDGSTLTLKSELRIRQPRYAIELSNGDVVVSTMYSKKAFIVDPAAMRLRDSIVLPYENPEGLTLAAGRLWICPWDTACNAIYPYNPATGQLEAPVALPGFAPQSAVVDRDGMLWVLSGNNYKRKEAWLTRINPSNGATLKSFRFGTADPLRPAMNGARDTLYFIEVSYAGGPVNNGVYRMGIDDAALPAVPFIAAAGIQYFWGVAVDPRTAEIYVADPLGFTQRGRVAVYGPDGALHRSFLTGVGPARFVF